MSIRDFWTRIFPIIKNKFIITSVLFVGWVGFFDQYNLVARFSNSQKLKQLEKDKLHYIVEIENNKRMLFELKGDNATLEKFAREQYLMKKKNEDIYLVIEK